MKAHIFVLTFILAFVQMRMQAQEAPAVQETPKVLKKQQPIPKHEVNIICSEPISPSLFIQQSYDRANAIATFSASYSYRLKKWLGLGGTFTYLPYHIHYYSFIYNDNGTTINAERKSHTLHGGIFSIAAEVRFFMLSRSWVNLYGGVALGYSAELSLNNSKYEVPKCFNSIPYWQVTLFGFSFGKNFIFGGEIGAGSKGVLSAYIGYKF